MASASADVQYTICDIGIFTTDNSLCTSQLRKTKGLVKISTLSSDQQELLRLKRATVEV